MKRILTALVLVASIGTANAQWYGHPGHHHRGYYEGGWGWVAPAVIGGAIVYGATRPVEAAPVIVQQVPQPNQVIQCPPGTMPFEQRGWVRNQFNQYVQTTYIECK